jgi:aryl-alcohol dehydrogenase-like predicted oxidoreductase
MSPDVLTREIGRSGIMASAVGLGTWAIGGWMWGGTDEVASVRAIEASIDAGISLIDTAPAYGLGRSEELVGQAIAGKRDKVVIATKCGLNWHGGKGNRFFEEDGVPVHRYLGSDGIAHEIEQSLRRLGTDHIDLYITHWQDPTTPIAETMDALLRLKEQGKIRAIGASNVEPTDLAAYLATGQLDAIQERYSMLDRGIAETLLPMTQPAGVATLSYSPLALGLLTGKVSATRVFEGDDQRAADPRFSPENRQRAADFAAALKPLADQHGASVAQLVIAWTLSQSGITFALCGARDPGQALDNARAARLRLNATDLARIEAARTSHLAAIP